MFRFAMDGRVRWPVTIEQVQDAGGTAPATIVVTFRVLTREEQRVRADTLRAYSQRMAELQADATPMSLQEAVEATNCRVADDDTLLAERVLDWSGIADANDAPIPFGQPALAAFIGNSLMRDALLRGLLDASAGAPAKNSLPGLAGMPVRAQA